MKNSKLLNALLMVIVMMAMSPQTLWAEGTQPTGTVVIDGKTFYQITSADELKWFADKANSSSTAAYGILEADIVLNDGLLDAVANNTLTNMTKWSNRYRFNGILDGQGHSISGLYCTNSYYGLCRSMVSGSIIRNLEIKDSYSSSSWYNGLICSDNNGTIENCIVSGTIKSSSYAGGLAAYNYGVIRNCVSHVNFSYNSSSESLGGIIYQSNANGKMENCYFDGTFQANNKKSCPITTDANGTITNCYYLSSSKCAEAVFVRATSFESADISSGKLCYNLNKSITDGNPAWYQTIGSDAQPVLNNTHSKVYAASLACDGTALTFSNTETSVSAPAHVFTENQRVDADAANHTDGHIAYKHCSTCGKDYDDSGKELTAEEIALHPFDENGICTATTHTTPVYQPAVLNGTVYEISNAGQMAWFRDYVNEDHLTANAKVMKDIDLTPVCHAASTGVTELSWIPIARSDKYSGTGYQGVFDGGKHKISNLYIKNFSTTNIGFFSGLGTNSQVKDLHVHGNVTDTNGKYQIAILAGCSNDCKLIDNVRTSGTVNTKGGDAAGLVGFVYGNKINTEIKNCINEASVTGYQKIAGIIGRTQNNKYTLENCGNIGNIHCTYATNTSSGVGGLIGTTSGGNKIINCYSSGNVSTIPSIQNTTNDIRGALFGYVSGSTSTVSGLYYVPVDGIKILVSPYNASSYPATAVTAADVTCGNLAYQLQGENTDLIWGQNLDNGNPVDAFPVPGAAKVYPARKNCGGKYDQFSNTTVDPIPEVTQHTLEDIAAVPSANNLDGSIAHKHCTICDKNFDADGDALTDEDLVAHVFDANGICTNTHATPAYQKPSYNKTSQTYEISNAGQLAWFGNFVNASSDNLKANAKLMDDIDLSPICSETLGKNWNPIARYDYYTYKGYQGVFDGNKKKITNLYIKNAGFSQCIGFFSVLGKNSEVKDLSINGTVIESQSHYINGILTGAAYDCKLIENVRISGSLNSNTSIVAGLIGEAFADNTNPVVTEIKGCINEANITGTYDVAGILGSAYRGSLKITNCGNVGTIKATGNSSSNGNGGIAGTFQCQQIDNCFSSGNVIAENDTYHMTGVLFGKLNSVAPTTESVGLYYVPIAGLNPIGGGTSSWYSNSSKYPSTTVTAADVANGNLAYLLQGENTDLVWGQNLDNGSTVDAFPVPGAAKVYPKHKNCGGKYDQFSNTAVTPIPEVTQHTLEDIAAVPSANNLDGTIAYKHCTVCDKNFDDNGKELSAEDLVAHSFDANGICTNTHTTPAYQPATAVYKQDQSLDYYAISKVGHLAWFRNYVNESVDHISANAQLTADIDMSPICSETSGKSWTPISDPNSQASTGYTGTFNGGGFKISNLYINGTSNYLGLFSKLGENSVVTNLKIDGKIVSTVGSAGLLAGQAGKSTKFEKIQTSGSVTANGSDVAGMVGYYYLYAGTGTITECSNSADVKGQVNVGGLFGRITGTNIVSLSDCANTGNIIFTYNGSSSTAVGGLVGVIAAKSASNCYSTGTITTTLTTTPTMPVGQLFGSVTSISSSISTGLYYHSLTDGIPAIGKGVSLTVKDVPVADFNNGKLAFDLQGTRQDLVWGQSIGSDNYPKLGGTRVYASSFNCDETAKSFTNDASVVATHDPHVFTSKTLTTTADADGLYHYACDNNCGSSSSESVIKECLGSGNNIELTGNSTAGFTTADAVTLTDDKGYSSPVAFTSSNSAKPTYTRTIAATTNWGTLVLPFALLTNDDVQFYELTNTGANTLTFEKVDAVAANTPCVFKKKDPSATSITFTAPDGSVTNSTPIEPSAVEGLSIKGTYTKKENQTGIYFIAQDQFWNAQNPITINPFRAWFEGTPSSSAGAKSFIIVDNDDTTNIGRIEDGELIIENSGKYMENGRIVIVKNGKKYNLSGQPIR